GGDSPTDAVDSVPHTPRPSAVRTNGMHGNGSSTGRHGSRTLTIAPAVSQEAAATPPGILHLRGSASGSGASESSSGNVQPPRVQWAEDTVDNEGLGRKKSKVCCIFRKQRAFGESDSDESDSCCSDGDSDTPNAYEYVPAAAKKKKKGGKCESHGHTH
ncbi:Type 1 phosphatases regulator ypi1, partial [Coemansia erecta]